MASDLTTTKQSDAVETTDVESTPVPFQQIEIVNAPNDMTQEQRDQLNALLDDLRLVFTWCATITSASVRRKLASGELPNEPKRIESYRLSVMEDCISRRALQWTSGDLHSTITNIIEEKLSDFTPKDLISLHNQVIPRPPATTQIQQALSLFAREIKKGPLGDETVERTYWFLLGQAKFDTITGTFSAALQRFRYQFKVTRFEKSTGVLGSKTTYVRVNPTLMGTQYDILASQFARVKSTLQKTIDQDSIDETLEDRPVDAV